MRTEFSIADGIGQIFLMPFLGYSMGYLVLCTC